MPGPGQDLYSQLWSLLTEPVFKGLIWGAISEYNRPCRPADLEDESVGDFLNRRLGTPNPGDNIVSAVIHGIYAGDIYQLSLKSLAPMLWHQEGWKGSVARAVVSRMTESVDFILNKDRELMNTLRPKIAGEFFDSMASTSVYSFKDGIGALSDVLEASLRANPNVQIKMNDGVNSVEYDSEKDGIEVCFPIDFDFLANISLDQNLL